ncbi:metal ABC transporter substrate-binding protein [Brevibacillus migulae]|uniref:metal ABC transporter substrate-binding protein n=1 Tax=Brevibacillus migulae TaxID=1644114 RepID=UPI001F3F01C6|nr:metal ABC transporter substrate-binding protein [Brevibacillus migulae]
MTHRKKLVWAVMTLVTVLLLTACSGGAAPAATGNQSAEDGKLTIYTTIYPLQYVASRIGGQWADVKSIVPAGIEPHDFEPSAQEMVALSNADLFVFNGAGLESWAEKAAEGFDPNQVKVVNATEGLTLLKPEEGHAAGETHEGEAHTDESAASEPAGEAAHEHEHEHGDFDPHVWLDPAMLKDQAAKVKDAMVAADQAHKADYEKNYEQLASDLDALDKDFKAMVEKAARKEFVVSHSAFSYLAHKYGLEQIGIAGVNPSDEPSPSEMKALIEEVKEHQIQVIFFETLVSPKVAEVIAREAGVKTATLNPLEGLTEEEAKAGKDYLIIMRENLEALRAALQ